MKLKISFFLLAFTALFAVTDAQYQDLQNRVAVLEQRPITPPTTCGENGWGVMVKVEPLIWKVSQDGLEYAVSARYDLVTTDVTTLVSFYQLDVDKGRVHAPDFKYDWGFRVGLGYLTPRDNWQVEADWARYNHSASDRVSKDGDPNPNNVLATSGGGSGEFISPFWVAQLFANPGLMNRAKALFNLEMDLLDIELGREFYLSNFLIVRPFVGFRAAWIDQKYRLSYTSFNFQQLTAPFTGDISRLIFVKMKNDMRGFGGRMGLGTKWVIWKGLGLCAEGAFSILRSRYSLSYFLHDRQPVPQLNLLGSGTVAAFPVVQGQAPFDDSYRVKNKLYTNTLISDFFVGLCWEQSFSNGRFCLNIWGGYELSVYYQQNRFMNHQYDFTLVSPFASAAIQGGNEGPNFFTDRGNMTTSGGSGGISFNF